RDCAALRATRAGRSRIHGVPRKEPLLRSRPCVTIAPTAILSHLAASASLAATRALQISQPPHNHISQIMSHILPQDSLLMILSQQELLRERKAPHVRNVGRRKQLLIPSSHRKPHSISKLILIRLILRRHGQRAPNHVIPENR